MNGSDIRLSVENLYECGISPCVHVGKHVEDALNILSFSQKKGARIVKKVLESAIANAEHNEGADVDELKISTIYVDESVTLKRLMPRAKGRADRILKRTCHITLKVSD